MHDGNAAWETRCLSDETGVLLVDLLFTLVEHGDHARIYT